MCAIIISYQSRVNRSSTRAFSLLPPLAQALLGAKYLSNLGMIPVAQPERHRPPTRSAVPRLSEGLMLLPTTPCDHVGLDPIPRACRVRRGWITYASRSNGFCACQWRVWRPAARSPVRSPRQISKNIRSYWIWKATAKIVVYATKCAVPRRGIPLRRTIASQIVVYATRFDSRL
jgi:hypothetical protein